MSQFESHLPTQPDSETVSLLRSFLCPILEQAKDWHHLRGTLTQRGYSLAFQEGHMVIVESDTNRVMCTGQHIGTPLRSLVERFGRPCVAVHRGGTSGELSA
ncbi:hypothetical protein [Primorskyibacter flagellatus]|uniref:Uncharacterized protein n=1 Tax=Primorskyibacter flagellatus TaxID=1387277 RepID=A0A1W1ZYA8_9RHOB|nr:hypothetical protein [Primorskyibacter flagellatus]SMC53346.1 hypothetical protein SAMN06295998_102244 [Primorskyibacter flagellatus]